MKKWLNVGLIPELALTLFPFVAGILIAEELRTRAFVWCGIMATVSVFNWVMMALRNYQRGKAVEELDAAGTFLKDAGNQMMRLVAENLRSQAVIAALLGLKMNVSVKVVKVKGADIGRGY